MLIFTEITSEKMAIGHIFDGQLHLLSEHTHVPTNDGRLLSNNAYLTDGYVW